MFKLFNGIFFKSFVNISLIFQNFGKLSFPPNWVVEPPVMTSFFISTFRKQFLFPEISKLTLKIHTAECFSRWIGQAWERFWGFLFVCLFVVLIQKALASGEPFTKDERTNGLGRE